MLHNVIASCQRPIRKTRDTQAQCHTQHVSSLISNVPALLRCSSATQVLVIRQELNSEGSKKCGIHFRQLRFPTNQSAETLRASESLWPATLSLSRSRDPRKRSND